MFCLTFLTCTIAIGTALLGSTSGHYVVHEKRTSMPTSWVKRSRASPDVRLSMRIGLAERNLDLGPQHLVNISDPASPHYGRHWTREQINNLFAPANETAEQVQSWLEEAGIQYDEKSSRHGWIDFNASVGELESLLRTEYHVFQQGMMDDYSIGCEQYSIPSRLRNHVDLITPTIGIYRERKKQPRKPTTSHLHSRQRLTEGDFTGGLRGCLSNLKPSCIRALYNIPQNTKAQAGNNLGIYIYGDNETYDQAGLDTFFASSATNIPAGTSPAVNSTEISTYPSIVSDELMLDLEVAYPLVYPQNISILEFAPTYQTSIKASDVNVNVTKVFSISYAGLEDLSNTEQKRQCNELMKLGLQGVSVLVSSGDDGVGSNCGGTFQVKYPSSCPYVTSVGGTMINPHGSNSDPEVATSPDHTFASGGGFSNTYAQPGYQLAAVANFLENHPPGYPSSYYNTSGRAYPDVSAIGIFNGYIGGSWNTQIGDSISTPVFASVITLINENRLAAGKSSVGFLNPVLYANPSAFNDITEGSNPGCNTKGFSAVSGWDPVTGLGTPKYESLLEVFMALP